jgi:hypothetical protein
LCRRFDAVLRLLEEPDDDSYIMESGREREVAQSEAVI